MAQRAAQIVCTIGPSSQSADVLERLVDAGMRVARINAAHGTPELLRELVTSVRRASESRERPVAVLLDLPGPKLRLGELDADGLELAPDQMLTLRCNAAKARSGELCTPDPHLPGEVTPGATLIIGDGDAELEVVDVDPPEIECRVVVGGRVTSGKGLNVPGGLTARPILEDADRRALELAVEQGVDFVGVSYVRSAEDLAEVRRVLRTLGASLPLVAKIETALALENLDEILARTDAVMIARGDLSLEIPYERVPLEQKRIVRAALCAGRPVITATQMLQSMVSAPRPTRAEATDVANAVLDGTDALMLSEETAIGADPVRACTAMARIIEATEAEGPRLQVPDPVGFAEDLRELIVFSRAAVRTASELGVRAILTWTRGGLAARMLARERPNVPILAPTRFPDAYRRLALVYGTRPLLCPSGRLPISLLEREIGPVDERALLLVVRHQAGDRRRIPWLGLVRVADREGWAQDSHD